jgi:uncharacterized protein (TIGR02145 family)
MKRIHFSLLLVATTLLLLNSCKQEDVFKEGGKSAGTVTDIDGNTYDCIKIGNQTWTVQNLKVKRFNNGDAIDTTMTYIYKRPNGLRPPIDVNVFLDSIPSCQFYMDLSNKYSIYGRYYNTKVITDSRNIAPAGWHVATDEDWAELENFLIANGCNWDKSTSGNKLAKSLASIGKWASFKNESSLENGMIIKDSLSNNKSGLSLLPCGKFEKGDTAWFDKKVNGKTIRYGELRKWSSKDTCAYYWSPSKDKKIISYRYMKNTLESSAKIIDFQKSVAYSIRCVKDK